MAGAAGAGARGGGGAGGRGGGAAAAQFPVERWLEGVTERFLLKLLKCSSPPKKPWHSGGGAVAAGGAGPAPRFQ